MLPVLLNRIIDWQGSMRVSGNGSEHDSETAANSLQNLRRLTDATLDDFRSDAVARRKSKGYRTARENLADLCDPNSFVEFGQLAVAAQRQRRSIDELREVTPAD